MRYCKLQWPVGFLKPMLDLFCVTTVQGERHTSWRFYRIYLNIVLCSDTYELVSSNTCELVSLNTYELVSLNLMWWKTQVYSSLSTGSNDLYPHSKPQGCENTRVCSVILFWSDWKRRNLLWWLIVQGRCDGWLCTGDVMVDCVREMTAEKFC